MKKIILALLIILPLADIAAPSANAAVVITVGHHRRHRPHKVWVPGHYEGHWWRKHWIPGHWIWVR